MSFNFMAAVTIYDDLEPKKIKSVTLSIISPSIYHEVMGPDRFPDDSEGKEFAGNTGHLGLIPGLGRFPGGGHGNPLQYSCLENSHGQRRLVGHSPWGH